MSFVLDANGVYSAISSLEQRAHGGDGAEEQQQAHRRWLQQLWGGEPSYVEQAEDRGRWLLSSLLYTWASPVMGVAAREALRTEDLPQPTRTFRAYNAGWRLSVEMQRQRERRHMWDDMLGQRVVLRRGRGCGVLRYVGPVQQYGLPDQLYAGVEWEEVPEGRATRSPVTPGALLFSGEVAGEHLFDYVEGTIAAITFEPVEDVAVFSASTASTKTTTHPRTISPHGALMSAMGWHLLPLGGLLLLVELEVFVSPMLLKAYIRYLNDQENREESSWCEGLTLVAAYGIMTTVHSLLFHAYQLQFMKCALLYRSALQACLFEKCCTISGRSLVLPHLHPGRIINLLSTDVDCVMNFCQTLWLAVTTPLQVLVGVYLLHQLVGWVGMAGVSVLLLGIPFQAVIARLVASCYRQWADATDARLRVANQFLRGIRAIKFLGREPEFVVAMEQRRAVELHWVHRAQNLWVAMLLGNTTLPHLATASLLLMYSRTGTHLMPELVYPAISVLGILQSPFQMLPLLVHTFAQYRTSMRRLRQFFEADEIQDSGVPLSCTDGDPHHAAVFDAATVRGYRASVLRPSTQGELPDVYDVRAKDLLRDVSLRIPRGKLSVVLGPTGSGKSTLVDSLIGALEVTRGRVAAESSIAYVPQQPWIMNATLRENVVFFAEMDAVRFERALACSQLLSDLSLLADGVETEIGEKGINLSGGQKARVSLARAVYADRELYLLDDPLSALDAHVGERVLEECVCGALGGKTRVLATHHVHAASRADYVIVMKDGVVTYQGSYRDFVCVRGEVLTDCFGFGVGGRNGSGVDDVSVHDDLPPSTLSYVASCDALDAAASARVSLPASASLRRHRGGSAVVCVEESPAVDVGDSERRGGGFEEERATGSVPLSTYWEYLRLCGSVRALVIVALVFVAMEAADQGPGLWLAAWTGGQLPTWSSASCMRVYMVLTAAAVVSTPVRLFACFVLARRGCRRIHERLLRTVASATLPFLEGTPTGLLMNRFAKDVRNIDAELPNAVLVFLLCGMYVASTMCVLISSQWVMLLVVIPCSIIFYRILLYSCAVSREVRRLLNVTYSPLLSLLGEAVHGRWIFAAFGKLPSLLAESRRRVDDVFACAYLQSVSIRWIGVRVDAFSTVLVTSLALMGVVSVHVPWLPLNAGFLYLSLTNSRGFMVVVTRLVAAAADVEASMNSVERVARYGNRNVVAWEDIDLLRDDGAGECSDVVVGDVSPAAPVLHVWDHGQGMGTLAVRHVSLRYRDGLPLVLRDVSFVIGAGQKVGVVGRTGSGKSTLLLAFLRLVEVCEGEIVVCGKPARSYALRELRQLFSMIPQDPVLFEGTVRSNVDPFGAASDAEVWDALEQVGMAERVRCEAGGVDCRVLEGGSNLSVGQRQLLCLARALLRRGSAFILMDEATANVDPALDRQIQQTVRETFRDYTVVTIAHRLHTVASYDMILVMDGGRLVESGSPRELVQRRGSAFEQLVESMGEEAQEEFRGALDRAELMQVAAEVATKRRSTRPM